MSFSHKFAVNGTWVYPPDGYQEVPVPTVGYTLSRRAVNQGYDQLVVGWTLLDQEKMAGVWGAWKDAVVANDTRVQVTYIEQSTGDLVTRYATIHAPLVGQRHTVFYEQVAMKFSHISDTA